MLIDLVAGARPNFMKIAPLYHELIEHPQFKPRIVHTGQHYDPNMSDFFFRDLGLPAPDIALRVGSGPAGWQTGQILTAYEHVLLQDPPSIVIVVGDVNSTLACALAAVKLGVPVCHLEAGLRSGDWSMPEEVNRVLVDRMADVLWTHSPEADEHLRAEGIDPKKITFVGNIMIDALEMVRARFTAMDRASAYGMGPGDYALVTLHRPENVDDFEQLRRVVTCLEHAADEIPILFPVHPRTLSRLRDSGFEQRLIDRPGITLAEPEGYVGFMSLAATARVVVTDSGGLQEETTHLKVPCLTLRKSTERPVTLARGSNRLVTTETMLDALRGAVTQSAVSLPRPELWDGATAGRVVADLNQRFSFFKAGGGASCGS